MRMSLSTVVKSEVRSLFKSQQDSQRQSLGRGWPAKKFITKKEGARKCKKKPALKKNPERNFSTQMNCHAIQIEETTQQGPNSSSLSKEQQKSQNNEATSFGFNFPGFDGNSNSTSQRICEVHEYLGSISDHMHSKELQYVPKLITDPNVVSQRNRTKLILWIFDLSSRFNCKSQTFFIAANIIDRALGIIKIPIDRLPLLGITALFMATKYQEILIPHLTFFVSAVPEIYKVTKQAILKLESSLLIILDFNLGYSSPLLFIHHLGMIRHIPECIKNKAVQIAKELIIGSACRYWASSKIAAHAIRTAQQVFQSQNLNSMINMPEISEYINA